ncbi:DUF4124 domain-containing protein [Pseudomonas matsuisoli]|uniref:DUF4124 domain-containing protein n=1 Tax=Pseudomonas matsuisoli TaxID=1515666 RepID=A0A917UYN4_9PSED|nr:DUF4124 domain-containing protein [Pseudomonas matsuisoli]GGJ99696.1 hypothetical protein GCM10009304_26860 [Pseudomonas matsuisoli]
MRRILTGFALTIAFSNAAFAVQVYKWQDSSGVIHFSALPPEDASAVKVDTRLAQLSKGGFPPALPKLDSQIAADEQLAIDERVKAQVAQQEVNRKKACTMLRTNLSHLKNNPRVRIEEPAGQMRRLTEEERQARIKDTEKGIGANCA